MAPFSAQKTECTFHSYTLVHTGQSLNTQAIEPQHLHSLLSYKIYCFRNFGVWSFLLLSVYSDGDQTWGSLYCFWNFEDVTLNFKLK